MGDSLVRIKERTQILSQALPLEFYAVWNGEEKEGLLNIFQLLHFFTYLMGYHQIKNKTNTSSVHVHAEL